MPPPSPIEDQIVDHYQVLYEALFFTPFADEISSRIQRNAVRRQIESAADAASRALTRFFTLQEISAEVVDEMLAAIEPLQERLTMERVTNPNVTPESLVKELLLDLPCPESLADLAPVYRVAFHAVIQGLTLMGPVMSDWRGSGFGSTFEIPTRVTARLNEISDRITAMAGGQSSAADERFELIYRDHLCQRFHRVEAGTVRMTTNQSVDLSELFVMPRVEKRPLPERSEEELAELMDLSAARELASRRARFPRLEQHEDDDEQEAKGEPAQGALTALSRAVVVGAPGSGKSTLFEWFQLQVAGAEQEIVMAEKQQAIPLLLKVRELDLNALPSGQRLIEAATASGDRARLMPEQWIERQMEQGLVLFLLDGLDEMEPERRDDTLFPWLTRLIEQYPHCRYLLSSRPSGYQPGSLASLGFVELDLLDFGHREVGDYTRHWCTAVRLAQREPEEEARRRGAEEGKVILDGFSDHTFIRDLARNPLMLSAICLVNYFENGKLPDDRAKLYALCVEGLLHHWDQRRGIHSEFGLAEKLRACREVAIAMQRDDRAEYEAESVRRIFMAALGDDERGDALFRHIRYRSGLLVERRPNIYAFAHLTFQEYLAASALHEGNALELTVESLIPQAEDPRWQEVIMLFCGIVPAPLARDVIEKILNTNLDQRGSIAGDAYLASCSGLTEGKEFRTKIIEAMCVEPIYRMNALERFPVEEVACAANQLIGKRRIGGIANHAELYLLNHAGAIDISALTNRISNISSLDSVTAEVAVLHAFNSNTQEALQALLENNHIFSLTLDDPLITCFRSTPSTPLSGTMLWGISGQWQEPGATTLLDQITLTTLDALNIFFDQQPKCTVNAPFTGRIITNIFLSGRPPFQGDPELQRRLAQAAKQFAFHLERTIGNNQAEMKFKDSARLWANRLIEQSHQPPDNDSTH